MKTEIVKVIERLRPEVDSYYLEMERLEKAREEVEKDPSLSKLAKGLPPGIPVLRILGIGAFDIQADGGTHVNTTKEVGTIKLIKCENKGKSNRRLYWELQ